MDDAFVLLKELRLENCEMTDMAVEKVILKVPESHVTQIKWTPRTHILIDDSLREILSNIQQVVSPPSTPNVSRHGKLATRQYERLKYFTAALENVHFHCQLDNGKLFSVKFDDLNLSSSCKEISIKSTLVKCEFDQNERDDPEPILKLEAAQLSLIDPDETVDKLRQTQMNINPTLVTPSNRVIRVFCRKCTMHFPFKYSFNDTFEHLIATFKMVKNLYKKHSEPFHPDSGLPPDLDIRVHMWTWTIEDDPFEIQLASLFMFKGYEYWDRQIRQNILLKKIDDLRLHSDEPITDVQIAAWFADLEKANTHAFITKIRKLKAENKWKKYENLFSWTVEQFHVTLLADQSMNGYEKMAELILKIDPALRDSNIDPWDYTTLWGRQIEMRALEWRVGLRDYSTNLILAKDCHWTGVLCGAEQRGLEEVNFRDITVDPGVPWPKITVPRNLCPLRYFHDIKMSYSLCEFGWGPSMEAAWGEFQHAFDRIATRPADNSPALPWWDKQRMKMRGRIVSEMTESTWHHLASRFPYCHEERLCWEWKSAGHAVSPGLQIDWRHGEIVFQGDLIICINTKRKYSNIHFMELPGLKMKWQIEWNLKGNNRTGHNLFPSAEMLPAGHDTYKNFRSSSLDLKWTVEVRNSMKIFLFSTTMRWLARFWKSITEVARPIKRGNGYWADPSQSKKKFSRHYRQASVSWRFGALLCEYQQSFSKKIGFIVQTGAGTFETKHLLTIDRPSGEILRRARAIWTIEHLSLKANETYLYLKNPTKNADNTDSVEKNFFASLGVLRYDRFAELDGENDRRKNKLEAADFKALWKVENRDCALQLYNAVECGRIMRQNLSANLTNMFSKIFLAQEKATGGSNRPSTPSPTGVSKFDNPMQQLLLGEATEFVESSEKAIEEDPIYTGWDITLRNCQVLLKGHENTGCMCLTADNMKWVRHEYQRAWRDGQYLDKFRLKGNLKGMQLFSLSSLDNSLEGAIWVPVDQIHQEFSPDLDPPENSPDQNYVKIVHPCCVTINYISYCPIPGNVDIPPISHEDVMRDKDIMSREKTINTLTLTQEKMEISTNNDQYLLALDLVNHLFLHVEPGMKERWDRQLLGRFQLQLQEDQTVEIKVNNLRQKLIEKAIELQRDIRTELASVRQSEQKLYTLMIEKEQATEDRIDYFNGQIVGLEEHLNEKKDFLNNRSEEMAVTLQLAKETHLRHQLLKEEENENSVRQTRRTHFNFHDIKWKLVSNTSGQPKGIANFILRDFEYRSVASVDSELHQKTNQNHNSHEFKVGDFELKNLLEDLLEDQKFTTILKPEDPISRSSYSALRVFCKVKPPVGGIPVKEHIELNMKPLTLEVTKKERV